MKIKTNVLERYLRHTQMTRTELARLMGVEAAEVDKMLDGRALGEDTARRFIRYFSANKARRYVKKTEQDAEQIEQFVNEDERFSDNFGDGDLL